jgi:hypothetical protein
VVHPLEEEAQQETVGRERARGRVQVPELVPVRAAVIRIIQLLGLILPPVRREAVSRPALIAENMRKYMILPIWGEQGIVLM